MKNPILLGVNIDHIATVRNARGTDYPDPVQAAFVAEQHGADGITVHLREDRRHITDRDVELLSSTIQTRMNLEMAVTDEMLSIAEKIKPMYVCLVPEKREELTTEGGLDVKGQENKIKDACQRMVEAGIRVSLFIDADEEQICSAARTGASLIELHTGHYADTNSEKQRELELVKIRRSVAHAVGEGLHVNAGHGLQYHNVQPIAAIQEIVELNIGHAIMGRALFSGLDQAVSDMKKLMVEARQWPHSA